MAYTHLQIGLTSTHGPQLKSVLTSLANAHKGLTDQLAIMATMIDGDGSDISQFDEVVARYGFPNTTVAKAAWDELNSCSAKLHTDGSVTFVNAAILQVLAKFG